VLLVACPAWAEPELERLLELLGVSAAARQADRIIEQNLTLMTQSSDGHRYSSAQLQLFRQQLLAASGSATVLASTQAYLAQNLPAESAQAEAILAQPIVARVRNFDVAMEMQGSFEKFQAYQRELGKTPPSEERLRLIQRLDQARRSSIIAALLQTEIEASCRTLLLRHSHNQTSHNQTDTTVSLLPSDEVTSRRQQQRQRYMAEVVSALDLYSYRYMQDEEIKQYLELLESSSIQTLLDASIQGLRQSLQAGRAIILQ
jgi:hypothetical protein